MRCITKNPEPPTFTKYKLQTGASYMNMPSNVKSDLRTALLTSQGGICCYCMKRINQTNTKIEHIKCQDIYNGLNGYPDLTLTFNNLFAACRGNEGSPYQSQTCDSFKANKELKHIDLYNSSCIKSISYLADGTICSNNQNISDEIDTILNLNQQTLKGNRAAVFRTIMDPIAKAKRDGTLTSKMFRDLLQRWENKDRNSNYREYCMVAIYVINRQYERYKKQVKYKKQVNHI